MVAGHRWWFWGCWHEWRDRPARDAFQDQASRDTLESYLLAFNRCQAPIVRNCWREIPSLPLGTSDTLLNMEVAQTLGWWCPLLARDCWRLDLGRYP
jgi:hypothetical protein